MTNKTLGESGFTLIELLLAMAVFSFMLLIILSGFMNVVSLHNQAVASNDAQDSARSAMDELVRAVRDSGGVASTPTPGPGGVLCLSSTVGVQQVYYVEGGVLKRADDCLARLSPHPITSSSVKVTNFDPVWENAGAGSGKSKVTFTLTLGTDNNSTGATGGATLACGPTAKDRSFCAVVTLTSGAVQR